MATENQASQGIQPASAPVGLSEHIQATGPTALAAPTGSAEPTRIPLPPPQVATPEAAEGVHLIFDATLGVLVLALTFLLGSFAATNSDLWMTLATGRNIAQGQYQFGVDPFAFTTTGTTWVNHQWLSAWILYAIYAVFGGAEGFGGAALVAFKAVALALLALLLLRVRWCGASRGWAILVVALAMLAVSTRVLLQPMTFSYLLLGVMFYLLYRGGALGTLAPEQTVSRRALWCVPVLFVAWVNLDSWFILGPVTVSLLAVGAVLGSAFLGIESPLPRSTWGALVGLGWLACLLNPHHIYGVLTLPPELAYLLCQVFGEGAISLASGGAGLDGGIALRTLHQLEPSVVLISPLSPSYVTNPSFGLSWTGLAFF